jgi:hypothetical protein
MRDGSWWWKLRASIHTFGVQRGNQNVILSIWQDICGLLDVFVSQQVDGGWVSESLFEIVKFVKLLKFFKLLQDLPNVKI